MYGYHEHVELSPEQLLQKITQQEIFEFVLKAKFDFGSRYCSPLRKDKKPGCRFEERPDGTIVFVDFGERFLTGNTHRTCFKMVMEAFSTDVNGAVTILCSEFKLSTNTHDYQFVQSTRTYEKGEDKQDTIILPDKKLHAKSDVLYWSQYLIKTHELDEDNVSSISGFRIKNHKGNFYIPCYKYAYALDFVHQVKIYQPYKDKYKWVTNCDENCIWNIDNLPPTGKELVIQKSYKDHRVLRNLDMGLNVVAFQNEGCVPGLDILKNLTERFELITIFYDNDEDGIKAAEKLVAIFNLLREGCARMVYLPKKRKHKQLFSHYLKDPSDFIHREGRQNLITVLKQIDIGKNT